MAMHVTTGPGLQQQQAYPHLPDPNSKRLRKIPILGTTASLAASSPFGLNHQYLKTIKLILQHERELQTCSELSALVRFFKSRQYSCEQIMTKITLLA